jgi:hypothetical protein
MKRALVLLLSLLPAVAAAQAPSLNLSVPAGSSKILERTVTLDSPASGATEWFAKADQRWVTVDPRTGVTPTRVSISINPEGLPAGLHKAVLKFVDDAGEDMLVVPVALAVGAPAGPAQAAAPAPAPAASNSAAGTKAAATTPATKSGASSPSPAAPARAPLTIAQNDLPPATRNLPYSQAVLVTGGKPPYLIRIIDGRLPMGIVLVNGALTGATKFQGTYPLAFAVTDSSVPPQTVTKTLVLPVLVIYQGTALSVSMPTIGVSVTAGQQLQGVRVAVGSGAQPLPWAITTDQPWMLASPSRGMAPGGFQLNVDARDLAPGTYVGTVTVTMDGAPNSPMRIPVQVTVRN